MRLPVVVPLAAVVLPLVAAAGTATKRDTLGDFNRRVDEYAKVHRTARSQVEGLKPTNSPAEIENYQRRLAERIRAARSAAVRGEIFAPEIEGLFRRIVASTVSGAGAEHIRRTLHDAVPKQVPAVRVNGQYPAGLPLQTMPPSLLLGLPPLPPEVEYRAVGHDLVLRDVDANLIVDFIPCAIP